MITVGIRRGCFLERDDDRDDLEVPSGDDEPPPAPMRLSLVLARSEPVKANWHTRGTAITYISGMPAGEDPIATIRWGKWKQIRISLLAESPDVIEPNLLHDVAIPPDFRHTTYHRR